MEVPTWVDIVKTASYKELAPYDPDWFYIRAASMARKLYVSGNMGVGAFRKNYGGAKNDGVCRFHHAIGSGSVARAILKQLESVGVVEKGPKGRRITPSGQVREFARREDLIQYFVWYTQPSRHTHPSLRACLVPLLTPCCPLSVCTCAALMADVLTFSPPLSLPTTAA
jgi:small subunit ribosomal protein S19e